MKKLTPRRDCAALFNNNIFKSDQVIYVNFQRSNSNIGIESLMTELVGVDWEGDWRPHHLVVSLPHCSHITYILTLYCIVLGDCSTAFNIWYLLSPLDSVERTVLVGLQPLVDAVHVEVVAALALDRSTVVPSIFAPGARHLKGVHADHAMGIADVPVPSGHRKPVVYLHLHFQI